MQHQQRGTRDIILFGTAAELYGKCDPNFEKKQNTTCMQHLQFSTHCWMLFTVIKLHINTSNVMWI